MKNNIVLDWAKYLEIDYFHAAADLDALCRGMKSDDLAVEFVKRRMNGDTISLKEFCLDHNIFTDWNLFL